MGQTTSCSGKRMKQALSCGSGRNATDTDEPPFKKRKNSRRHSRIFPSAEKENEANNAVSASMIEDSFSVVSGDQGHDKLEDYEKCEYPEKQEDDRKLSQQPVEVDDHRKLSDQLLKTDSKNGGVDVSGVDIDISGKLKDIKFIDAVADRSESGYSGNAELSAINTLENSPFHAIQDKLRYSGNSAIEDEGESPEIQESGADEDTLLVERRQLEILTRLASLQKEVQALADEAGFTLPTFTTPYPKSDSSNVADTSCNPLGSNGSIHDIVVSADPNQPPLSLFVLYEILKTHYKIMGRVHVHSSVASVPDCVRNVFADDIGTKRSDYRVAVTLIWKKVEFGPSLMVSGHSQTPIIGEANILRYLGRLLQPPYDTTDPLLTTLIDDHIDTANHLILNGKSRDRTAAIKSINQKLSNSDWLVGETMSLADIAVWSALKQAEQTKTCPQKVASWMENLSLQSEFQRASTLLK